MADDGWWEDARGGRMALRARLVGELLGCGAARALSALRAATVGRAPPPTAASAY